MQHKLKQDSGKKAYLQIDFAFAILIFSFFILATYSYYKSYEGAQLDALEFSKLESDARDICYLLSSTPGSPNNWEESFTATQFFGLKSATQRNLTLNKITVFNSSNYFGVIDTMGLEENFIKITIEGLQTNTSYLNWGVSGAVDSYKGTNVCYANYNSEIVRIYVEVWN